MQVMSFLPSPKHVGRGAMQIMSFLPGPTHVVPPRRWRSYDGNWKVVLPSGGIVLEVSTLSQFTHCRQTSRESSFGERKCSRHLFLVCML